MLAAVDWAVTRGIANSTRLGVGGWSYGGILTNYVIAQDRRSKAATSAAGMSNILAGYGTDQYVREYETELGRPWETTKVWLKLSSPFLNADRIVTPTLFLCGEKDFNVPLLNSEQMYQALRSLGRETMLVIYPGEYHGIDRPSFIRDRLGRYIAWYDRFLKGDGRSGGQPNGEPVPMSRRTDRRQVRHLTDGAHRSASRSLHPAMHHYLSLIVGKECRAMRQLHRYMRLASVAGMGLGCAIGGAAAPARVDSGPVEVRVENRSWSDAAIYLMSDGFVQRIGLATAVGTTSLWIPARRLGHSNDIRIVSAPIGSNRSHATEPLLVRPGQLIELRLENNVGLSSWGVW